MTGQSPLSKEQLERLYDQGLSLKEISILLNYSVHKVVYWMQRHNIPRRSRSDAAYIKLNPNGDPFVINTNLSPFLYGLGLGIFWGEGTKATDHIVRVTNTDPSLIRVFRMFLISVCGVKDEKIHYSIVAFNDSDISVVSGYWSKQLKISPEKFGKIVQIAPQGKGSYKRKSQFGVCSITVSNVKLKHWITIELQMIEHARIV